MVVCSVIRPLYFQWRQSIDWLMAAHLVHIGTLNCVPFEMALKASEESSKNYQNPRQSTLIVPVKCLHYLRIIMVLCCSFESWIPYFCVSTHTIAYFVNGSRISRTYGEESSVTEHNFLCILDHLLMQQNLSNENWLRLCVFLVLIPILLWNSTC